MPRTWSRPRSTFTAHPRTCHSISCQGSRGTGRWTSRCQIRSGLAAPTRHSFLPSRSWGGSLAERDSSAGIVSRALHPALASRYTARRRGGEGMESGRRGTVAGESARSRMLAYAREVKKREEVNRIRRISRAVHSTGPRAAGTTHRAPGTARLRRRPRPSPSEGPPTVPRQLKFLDSPEDLPGLSPLSPGQSPPSSSSSSPELSPSLAYHYPPAFRMRLDAVHESPRPPATASPPLSRLQRRRIMRAVARRARGPAEAHASPPPASPSRQLHHSTGGADHAPQSSPTPGASLGAVEALRRARRSRVEERASPLDPSLGHGHHAAALPVPQSVPPTTSMNQVSPHAWHATPPSVRAALWDAFAAAGAAKEGLQAAVTHSHPAPAANSPSRARSSGGGTAGGEDQPLSAAPAAARAFHHWHRVAAQKRCRCRALRRGWNAMWGHATLARAARHCRRRRLRWALSALQRIAGGATAQARRAVALRRRNVQRGVFIRLALACAASIRREHEARAFAHRAALARHFRALSELQLARRLYRAATSRRAMRQWRALWRRRRALRRPAQRLLAITVDRVRRSRAFSALRETARRGRGAGVEAPLSATPSAEGCEPAGLVEVVPVRRAFHAPWAPPPLAPSDAARPSSLPSAAGGEAEGVRPVAGASPTLARGRGAHSPPATLTPTFGLDGRDVRATAAHGAYFGARLASLPADCRPRRATGCDVAADTNAAFPAGNAGIRRAGPRRRRPRPCFRRGAC